MSFNTGFGLSSAEGLIVSHFFPGGNINMLLISFHRRLRQIESTPRIIDGIEKCNFTNSLLIQFSSKYTSKRINCVS